MRWGGRPDDSQFYLNSDQAAVGKVVAGIRRQVIGSTRRAGVKQIFTGYQVRIVTGDQPAPRREAIVGPG